VSTRRARKCLFFLISISGSYDFLKTVIQAHIVHDSDITKSGITMHMYYNNEVLSFTVHNIPVYALPDLIFTKLTAWVHVYFVLKNI